MDRKLLLTVTAFLSYPLLFSTSPALAVDLPTPNLTVLESITATSMYFNDDTGYRIAEMPPFPLGTKTAGGEYVYVVSSYNTHFCQTPYSIFNPPSYQKLTNCKIRASSYVNPNGHSVYYQPWSRDYSGAFSGHLIGNTFYLINHGELNNNNYWSTSANQCVAAPDIGYGTYSCDPANFGPSYNGFVFLSSFAYTEANYYSDNFAVDQGPIVWPSNGYVQNGQKATYLGVRHPTSIIDNNYLYVYYIDGSQGDRAAGRGDGVKVARAPIVNNQVSATSFKTYYNGEWSDPALPSGFDLNQVGSFFSRQGGRSTDVFGVGLTYSSISVAKIAGYNAYLAVLQNLGSGVVLRYSTDLVHWGPEIVVPGTAYNHTLNNSQTELNAQPLGYPLLGNSNGDSSTLIDPNDFFITGITKTTTFSPIVNRIRLRLNLPSVITNPPTSPSPSSIPGDFSGDGKVNGIDYTILSTNFGTKYTVLDYADLLANYRK